MNEVTFEIKTDKNVNKPFYIIRGLKSIGCVISNLDSREEAEEKAKKFVKKGYHKVTIINYVPEA